jgi:hypothetical protein
MLIGMRERAVTAPNTPFFKAYRMTSRRATPASTALLVLAREHHYTPEPMLANAISPLHCI